MRWVLEDAGICRNPASLHSRVYRWKKDVTQSAVDMYLRIKTGLDVYGKALLDDERDALTHITSPELLRTWGDQLAIPFDGSAETAGRIIAGNKERKVPLLLRNPNSVRVLAPLVDGFVPFVQQHSRVQIVVISSAQADTSIIPVMDAWSKVDDTYRSIFLKRFTCHDPYDLVAGAEHMGGIGKPHKRGYERAMIHFAGKLVPGTKVSDLLYLTDDRSDKPPETMLWQTIFIGGDRPHYLSPTESAVPSFQFLLDLQCLNRSASIPLQRLSRTPRI